MGKRKFSGSEADFLDEDGSDSDDQFDASYESKTRRKSASNRQTNKKRTRHDLDGANDVSGASPRIPSHAKSMHVMNAAEVPSVRAALVQWYWTVHSSRQMPWRKQCNPATMDREQRSQRAYEVWISEIMLQQTQVATVIPYYVRWLEKFPTIRDLAGASIDEVNSLWKGLGYYSRASRLLAGAKKAVQEYDGRLPDNAKDMQANIPGIGRYSAGAICSIAYGENVPVLDGNVNRLLSRFLALHAPPKAKATLDILWNAATAMVHDLGSTCERPGDINQALIELGSTVCKVRDPSCASCPVRTWCSAYTAIQTTSTIIPLTDIEDLCEICEPLTDDMAVTAYPMKVSKKKAREELDLVNVVEWRSGSDRQFMLVRRPESGLLAGLDEFPTSPNVSASLSRAQQLKKPHEILSNLLHPGIHLLDIAQKSAPDGSKTSLRITKVQPAGDVVHVFSHIKKTYRVQWVVLEGTVELPQFADANALEEVPNASNRKGKGKARKTDKMPDAIPRSTWVPLDAVAEKNMGTGSMKVWNLCRTLWEAEE
ncbi:DNA glycosylase [Mycena galopus ATCC 62051]|nr:DNA glycosylase [Mycena galopus ATCC 62051]